MKTFALWLIAFYQKVLTLASFGSCRYYPTCSEYAKWQVMHNRLLFGLGASLLRILRCNQLFPGGIDYPVVLKRFHPYSMIQPFTCKTIHVKFWFIPKGPHHYYVIKSFACSKSN
ncbi:membrane protein insertion efficiency factor YidD [Sulfurospirillum sp. T05]|uniref:Putative membrane protein insertion efficiency factor n=1 Tax=Sulfurospirillum tamanense TaxID=2813362 RepID=A0ABS2WRL8_9BACT|nr:membrane protein insertion efficiency factor YidD [Sulfurospirillum tamanensis]MBN2964317.1 membrane protein insertion efficiency factor YidD [Sulfurospirillum tamanensis]